MGLTDELSIGSMGGLIQN